MRIMTFHRFFVWALWVLPASPVVSSGCTGDASQSAPTLQDHPTSPGPGARDASARTGEEADADTYGARCSGSMSEGCPCTSEDEIVDCGKVYFVSGDYVHCSDGLRACHAGKWGACVGDRLVSPP